MVNNTKNNVISNEQIATTNISQEDMIYMEYLIQKEIVRLLKKESREGGEKALLAAIKLREERPYLRVLRFFCERRVH
jgi:predicted nucleic acid-binding protein